ncbi:MAG TPA: hypothetical protein VHW72_04645 [Candidatus Angelobacter sp.]|jgi:hypothetical protein|nr:hypothetical protein [Candidatus Angelobacter sp.]
MRADRAEVSWDSEKSKWVVRISAGEEVIRRYCSLPQTASETDLRAAAETTLRDEGYELDGAAITVQKSKVA